MYLNGFSLSKLKQPSIFPCSLTEYAKSGQFGSTLQINHMKIFFQDRMKTVS